VMSVDDSEALISCQIHRSSVYTENWNCHEVRPIVI
jgi:hypothetical protein